MFNFFKKNQGLKKGDHAPEFLLLDQDGVLRSLKDFLEKPLVIYFYPKDDTPGCTKEACMIRDAYNDFEAKGVTVVGISHDDPAVHRAFREKYELPFTLLSDPEKITIRTYGAHGSLFTKRISYLIGTDGVILQVYPEVDPASHAGELLNDLTSYGFTHS